MKEATVTSVQGAGMWKEKQLYKFEVAFDNGFVGTRYSKTAECDLKQGQRIKYLTNDKGTIRPVQEAAMPQHKKQSGRSPEEQTRISRQSAVKAAADVVIHDDGATTLDRVLDTAEIIHEWQLSGDRPQQAPMTPSFVV